MNNIFKPYLPVQTYPLDSNFVVINKSFLRNLPRNLSKNAMRVLLMEVLPCLDSDLPRKLHKKGFSDFSGYDKSVVSKGITNLVENNIIEPEKKIYNDDSGRKGFYRITQNIPAPTVYEPQSAEVHADTSTE